MLDGWGNVDGPLHSRLACGLRRLVIGGSLPAGIRLPSERILADGLGISRNTVTTAFDELRSEGVLASRQGSGTYVSLAGGHAGVRGDDRLAQYASVTLAETLDLRSAALPGLPLVLEEFNRLGSTDLARLVPSHGYLPGGLPELRDAVAHYYTELGLPSAGEQILVTSGAQQALRLVATALLEPGATVLVEEPTFRGAIEVLRGVGARLVPVLPRPGRVVASELRAMVDRYRPALILVQSTVHNPTGGVLHEASRVALTRVAAECGVPVLDDAAPADALVDGPAPKPLAAFGGPVLTIGSASKAFWGGLRVGWLRADPETVRSLTSVKGGEDLGTSMLAQLLTIRLLPRIEEARAARRIALARARCRVLETLSLVLPDWVPTRPEGGASVWLRLPRACATSFAQRCERDGVLVLPGPMFSAVDQLDDHLRIAFAGPLEEVVSGIERIATLWRVHC